MTIRPRTEPRSSRAAFAAILFAFFCFGSLFGVWQVVLEDLKQALGIGSGALGTAMTIGFFASLPAMLAGGKIADRFGVVPVIAVSSFCIALAYVGLAVVDTYFVLIGLMLAFFGFAGVLDVGLNAAAVAYEQSTGKRALGFFHATFSAAAASSAILTGLFLTFGIDFRLLYLAVSMLLLILAALSLFGKVFPGQQRVEEDASVDHLGQNPGLYRNPLILLLAFITMLGFFGESALSSWSAIYLRGSLDLPAVLGASGVAVFHIAMAVGRLSAGAAVVRFSQAVRPHGCRQHRRGRHGGRARDATAVPDSHRFHFRRPRLGSHCPDRILDRRRHRAGASRRGNVGDHGSQLRRPSPGPRDHRPERRGGRVAYGFVSGHRRRHRHSRSFRKIAHSLDGREETSSATGTSQEVMTKFLLPAESALRSCGLD